MRNKIISLFISIFTLISIIGPSIDVAYAESENISTKPIDEFETEESGTKLEEDNTIKTTDELSENEEKVNTEDNLLTENPETMGSAEKAPGGNNLTEIYLDSVNGDDSNDGSEGNPVKTFAKSMDIINDGGGLSMFLA